MVERLASYIELWIQGDDVHLSSDAMALVAQHDGSCSYRLAYAPGQRLSFVSGGNWREAIVLRCISWALTAGLSRVSWDASGVPVCVFCCPPCLLLTGLRLRFAARPALALCRSACACAVLPVLRLRFAARPALALCCPFCACALPLGLRLRCAARLALALCRSACACGVLTNT